MADKGLKHKTAEAAEFVAAKSIKFARFAAEKTKLFAQITKLNAEIATEKEAVRRAQLELGKLYYENFGGEPDEVLAECCGQITVSLELVRVKREIIGMLKRGEDISNPVEVQGELAEYALSLAEGETEPEEAADESELFEPEDRE